MKPVHVKARYVDELCNVVIQRVCGHLNLKLTDVDGMPVARVSFFDPGVNLEENEILAKDWSENEGIVEALIEAGVLEDTGARVMYAYGQLLGRVCKVKILEEEAA